MLSRCSFSNQIYFSSRKVTDYLQKKSKINIILKLIEKKSKKLKLTTEVYDFIMV